MSKIKQVLLLSSMQQTILLLLCAFLMPIEGWSASYPVNRDYGSQGDFIAKRGTEFGRTADLTPIGPVLINLPEAPGSTSNGVEWRFETTAWDLSDLTNPQLIRSLTCPTCFSGQPMSAHGTIIRLDKERNEAQLFAVDPQFVVYDPNGIDSNAQVLGVDRTPDNYVGGMLAPYATAGFWEYGFQPGPLWIREPRTPFTPSPEFPTDRGAPWLGAFVAEWDHLGLTSVTGFTAFLGELLIVASDQQSTGIAIYDRSGLKDGETPRLISQFRPNLTEPDGSPISVGGYWMEPYGANKIVWAARPRDIAPARDYPAMYVVDFTDPTNPQLTCEIYFDLDRNDPSDGDGSSDPMYVNFQDQYAFVDHFKVDIDACEQAYAGDQNIDAVELAQISYKFDDIANHCDGSQYFRPLGQVGVFGGYDWWVTDSIISYTGGTMTNWQWHSRPDGAGFNPVVTLGAGRAMVSPAIRNGETVNIQVGDVFTNGFTEQQYTVTNVERDARINEQGMCFMVTSDVADTRAPFVSGHRPLANQVDVPVDTYIHIHIPETLRSETLVNATRVIRVDDNGNEIESVTFESQFSHTGTLSIWPNSDLVVDASYRVELTGVQDYMGNTMEDYSFVFSTGDTVIAPPPPDTTPPPTYAGPTYYPNQSSEMSCLAESQENNIWVVNPDNDSVTIIDTNHDAESFLLSEEVVNEIDLGYKQPTSVTHIEGVYAITYRGDDKVAFLSSNGVEQFSVDTGYGSQPIASITDGQFLYVSLYGSGEVLKLDIANQNIVSRLVVGEKPKAMALREERLLVTRFISAPDHGEVYDIDTSGDMSLSRTIRVNKVGVADDLDHGSGVPNMLSSIVISPDGETAYITAIKANVDRGLFRNGVPLDSDNTVRPMLAILDLVQNRDANVDTSTREGTLDFDNAADPSFITYLADGEHRVTSLRGNNVVLVQNNILNTSAQFNTGFAPRSACATLRTLYVKNFTDRSISAIDVAPYMHDGTRSSRTLTINTVANEILSAEEKQGLRVFYHSSQPEMGDEGYMTCASCHTDGGQDGMTWDLTSLGEGMRNTLSLNGTQGTRFGDLHWSGNFDEVQDFELQIEQLNGGDGLIEGRTFNGQSPLDFESANRSADLDALAAYVSSLGKDSLQRSPYRTTAGGLTDAAQQGQQLFQQQGCASCHQGAAFRDGQRHDVGTLTEASGSRLTGLLTDIRTPTLVELWDSAPYFHDGSAATLEDVLSRGTHQVSINQSDRNDLIEFLLSIDSSVFIDDDAQWPDLPINRSPTVINPIADQMTVVGQPYEFVIPQNVFNDVDGGTLTIRAGSLMPSWLSFNSDLLVLSGTPAQVGSVEIEVVADDGQGGSVSDFFILNITANSSLDAVDDTVVGELLDDGRIRILISDLLANDSPGQGGLQIPYLDDWINGVAQLNSQVGEEIIFIPEGVENGQFTYALEDSSGAIDWAIVTVLVNAQPEDTEPPVITIDGYASGSTINLTVGDAFSIPSATATDNVDGAVSVTTSGSVDVNQAGSYTISYSATDAAGNTAQSQLIVIVSPPADTEPPVITINGYEPDDTINLIVDEAFSVPLATAIDAEDGAVLVTTSGSVDVSQVGSYIITYAAVDAAGNSANASLTVIVRMADSPLDAVNDVVSGEVLDDGRIRILISELLANDSLGQGGASIPYLDDWINGVAQLNSAAEEILFTPSGSQNGQFTYALIDSSDAVDWAIVTVVVNSQPSDTVPPVISINGYASGDTINLTVGDTFSIPSATAIDNVDGAVSVTTSGSVDVNQTGSYVITYSASDAAGNTTNSIVTVRVNEANPSLGYLALSDTERAVYPVFSANGEFTLTGRLRITEATANQNSFTSSSTGDYIAYQGHNGRVRAHILGTNFTVNTGQLAEGAFIDFSLSRDAGNNVRLVVNGASTGFKRSGMLTFDGFNGTNHFFAATFDNGATDQRNYDFNVPENATLILDTIGGENATVIRDGEPQTDTEPPVISIEGYLSGDTINLTVGDTFSIPTATAIDNVDGAVSVTTSGSVDVNQAGSYAITYSATDVAGNIASANLSFIVTEDVTNPPNTPPNAVNRVRQFTFNHSLWQHNFDNNAVTGYWVGDFANASGTTYAWSGQFGQLDYHDLPPSPSLGSTNTLPLWDNEDTNAPNYQATFEGVDLDNIIIMPNNFEQAGTSIVTEAYFSDALRVIDDVAIRQPDAPIVIYEHWPELNNASYPPTPEQESAYHLAQLGNAHQWFVNYQNEIAQRRPDANIRMIPVGPILSEIFTNPIFQASEMSWEERYDDNAPHGTPSLYFLAGLITYQAMFGQPVVDSYVAPSQIDVRIRNQFSTLNDFIWQRLNFYNANGVRVWSEGADNIVPTVEVSDNAALIAAINEMTDGGIIALQPGTYNCFQINERDYSAASPLVIQGNSSDNSQVIVEGRSASGSRCTNAVRVDNSSYVAFRNFSIQDGLDGMLISTSEHVIVDNLAISLSDQAGIVVNKNSADVDIVNSRIFNTGNQNPQYGECIYIGTGGSQGFPDETVRVWIEGNDISNCGFAEAINIKPEVFDSTVRNNRISDISPGNPLWSQYNQAAITVEGGRGSNPDNNHRPQDERNVWLENNTITNVTYSNPDDTRANPVNGSSKRSFANGIMVGATGVHIVGNTISNYEENGILLNNYGNLGLPTYRFGNVIAEPTVARDPNPAFPNREIFTAIRNSTIVTSQQAANTLTRQTWLP